MFPFEELWAGFGTRPLPWGRTAKLERELQTQLHRAGATGTDDRVGGGYIRRGTPTSERLRRWIVVCKSILSSEWIRKIGMVENVKELRAELGGKTLAKFPVLGYRRNPHS